MQREQITQSGIERTFDLGLALEQLIECAVPLLELARFHLHPRRPTGFARRLVAPLRHPSPAGAIAHEVDLQSCQAPEGNIG